MNGPFDVRMKTVPETGLMSWLLPRTGGGGGGGAVAENVWSGPNVVPELLAATSRTW
jgi:hypothetical protein